jgi:hypothetical protein
LRQTGDDPEPAGIRHGGGHLGIADAVHAALDDRMFYSEEFGYPRSHRFLAFLAFTVTLRA